jgi:fibronectin-binding autotransporter adhesin
MKNRKLLLLPCLFTLTTAISHSADITWDTAATAGIQGGAGTWNTSTANWTTDAGVSNIAWDNTANAADSALFTTGTGRITLTEDIFLQELKISSVNTSSIGGRTNTYVYSGTGSFQFGNQQGVLDTTGSGTRMAQIDNPLLGTGGLVVKSTGAATGDGWLTLAGNNSALTGGIRIDSGLLAVATPQALGSNTITLNGGGLFTNVNRSGPSSEIVGPTNLHLANNIVVNDVAGNVIRTWGSRNVFFTGTVSGDGGFNKADGGAAFLANSSLTSAITLSGGTLWLNQLNNGGQVTISGFHTLGYLGTSETTDRVVHFSSGSGGQISSHGNLNFTSNMTGVASGMGVTITGGGAASMNGISTGALLNFNKQGLGIWTVNGDITPNGGNIRMQGGILAFSASSSTTGNAIIGTASSGRTNNGVVRFAAGSSVQSASANTNGILGGWATFDNSTWAKTNGSGNAIDGLSTFTDDTWAAGNNTNITLAGADPASGSTTHSLRFHETGAKTLTLAGINTITSGGVLVTANVGSNTTTISGGTLTTTGANNDLILHQFNSSANLTVSSVLSNNVREARIGTTTSGSNSITGLTSTSDLAVGMLITGTGIPANATITAINSATQITISGNATATGTPSLSPVGVTSLTKTGAGTVLLSGANNYTGTTRVFEGTLRVTGNNGNKFYEVGSQGRLELDIDGGTSGYGRGILVNGEGVNSTNGVYLAGGRNFNFQSALRLAGAPTTVRQFGTGNAILHGWDSNGTHLVVENTASGSVIGTNVNFASGGFGYVMNIDQGLNTAAGDITIQGILTGSTVYRKNGLGSVRLDGAGSSTNTGTFDIRQGTLILAGANNRLGPGSNVILGNGANSGLLVLEGVNQTLTALTTAGTGTDNRVVGGSATLSTLTINNTAAATLAAHLGGTGANHNNLALTKSGSGTLTLSGTNTHTGPTTVTAGTLQLAGRSALANGNSAAWTADSLIVQNGATLALNAGGAGQFTAADLDVIKTLGTATGGFLNGARLGIDTTGGDLAYSGGIANPNGGTNALGLTKLGTGTLTLSGANTFTGGITIAGGTLEMQSKTTDVPYTINQGATLRIGYTNAGGYTNSKIQINGDGTAATTGLYLQGGTTYNASGTIDLLTAPTTIRHYGTGLAGLGMFDINGNALNVTAAASGSEIDANIEMISRGFGMSMTVASGANTATGDLVIHGRLNVGNLGFYKRGTGSVLLNQAASGSNAAVQIQGGTVIAGTSNVLGANANLPISAGASLRVNGFDQAARNLSGAGSVVNGSATAATLTIGSTADTTFTGVLGGTGTDENNFGLTKTGNSTLTLSGTNTYSGETLVSAGTLLVTGALSNSSVSVSAGATIGGTGTLGQDLGMDAGALFQVLSFATPLSVGGTVTFGAGFGIANLVGFDWDALDLETPYTILSSSQTFTASDIDNFGIANAVPVGTGRQAYFQDGSLQVVVIPEPSAALLGGIGLLLLLRRRRTRP